ncbi:hypothetical protein Stsp02_38150 [Streptomyces sp. NBRC 14336]|uniref:hypothetical protein n=1 Tax=Streptomyces sp. NBRC 14336 TaxID=3030992 RepID=UPI0024A03EDF|nr:hypothetical protein [Streptomyces sp. NBRC 14336]WBO80895.1 hypothetical protein SBE_004707 [Streptomyces sp. SBE_14.2]GLW48153.1 hypothetical protein Stsp02_38150 [Streptomyces sp. NBRC 14336]
MNDQAPQHPESQSAISEPELVGSSQPPLPPAPPTQPGGWYGAPSAPPTQPAGWYGAPPAPRRRRGLVIGAVAAVILLAGGGVTWWALTRDGDAIDHVELSGGKLVKDTTDAYGGECDDTDEYAYNDCEESADAVYEFKYKITNKGDGPANYSVIVNAFDEDGDYVGQTYIGASHVAAGKTETEKSEFDEYTTLEEGRELSDIDSVKVAWVERMALAN